MDPKSWHTTSSSPPLTVSACDIGLVTVSVWVVCDVRHLTVYVCVCDVHTDDGGEDEDTEEVTDDHEHVSAEDLFYEYYVILFNDLNFNCQYVKLIINPSLSLYCTWYGA